MNIRRSPSFRIALSLLLLFVAFTVVVSHVDIQPIGPTESPVGLATLNRFVLEHVGVHLFWYHFTDWLGIISLLPAAIFALTGLYQWLRRKRLAKVDIHILLLGLFYLLVCAAYLFFEVFVVNYRPVLLGPVPEASYPSSHTMLAICILSTSMMQFHRIPDRHKALRIALRILFSLLICTTVIGRLLSGVHWCTDIIGGILLSAALVMLYHASVLSISAKHSAPPCHHRRSGV